MKTLCAILLAMTTTSCMHDYYKAKFQEELRPRPSQMERILDKCVDVCGMGNVKICLPRIGQVECHQPK